MPWADPDIATTVSAARMIRDSLGARFRSKVPGSSYVGTIPDFELNTTADAYATRKLVEQLAVDVAAIRRHLGA